LLPEGREVEWFRPIEDHHDDSTAHQCSRADVLIEGQVNHRSGCSGRRGRQSKAGRLVRHGKGTARYGLLGGPCDGAG
jgi:hypothetical protein